MNDISGALKKDLKDPAIDIEYSMLLGQQKRLQTMNTGVCADPVNWLFWCGVLMLGLCGVYFI